MTIIRVIFSCSYCWTVLKFDYSWLLASQLNYFEVCIFFKAKSLYSATVVCFFIGSINSECNKHFFSPYCRLTTAFTIQVMLLITIDSASSVIWNESPCASIMTNKAEFSIGRPMALRCFILVFQYNTRELRNLAWNDRAQSR